MSQKSYREKLEDRLHEWSEEIDRLKARAETTAGETRESLSEYVKEVGEKQKVVRKKLIELGETTEEGYEHVKQGVENAFRDLRKGIDRILSTFRKAA